jgi:predicted O-methyltransferase YrrM
MFHIDANRDWGGQWQPAFGVKKEIPANTKGKTNVNIGHFFHDVLRSPYYRSRPVQTIRLAYAKWVFAKHRVDDVRQFLGGLGINLESALAGFDTWEPRLDQMLSRVRTQEGQHGGISREDGIILYALTRALQPNVVIETGIAAGVSTAFLGAALVENKHGKLFSIELPTKEVDGQRQDGFLFDWPKLGVGWAVPPEIREAMGERHVMLLEDVRSALPRLLAQLGTVDLFFHDDLHEPDHMRSEYELVWPYLSPGGFLISDDVNYGWLSFAKRHDINGSALPNVQRLAALKKA